MALLIGSLTFLTLYKMTLDPLVPLLSVCSMHDRYTDVAMYLLLRNREDSEHMSFPLSQDRYPVSK